MAGLVPAIHAAPRIGAAWAGPKFGMVLNSRNVAAGALASVGIFQARGVDGRDKPGHDG